MTKFLKKYLLIHLSLFSVMSYATDLDWSGIYRIEGNHIVNSELSDDGREKDYGLHHLVLMPKIVAGDGLIIYGRFDILNSSDAGNTNSQMGQVFGSGIGTTGADANTSDALADRQKSETLEVTRLYLTYAQEHGSFLAGRAPVHFGLGMSFNAGNGLFDHWYDSRDLVGYKIVMGNFYFLPMLAKINEDALNTNDDMTEYLFQLQYENLETELEMGIIHAIRKSNDSGNDAPQGTADGEVFGGTASSRSALNIQTTNLFVARQRENFRFSLEAAIQGGKTGVITSSGSDTSLSGFGLATELDYFPDGKKVSYGFRAGMASGDDPTTDEKFEGFIFDKNYDVAMLLFNHPVGQADFFRTGISGSGAGTVPVATADTEAISNVVYFAPYFKYAWKENWDFKTTLITGYLDQEPIIGTEVSKDLGYELDFTLSFSPKKGVVWQNEFGMLMPGSAFEAGGQFDSSFAYGFSTKAAISF